MSNQINIKSAMVLAAGLGTRMRPLTLTTPKPLVEIAGRCLLDRALDSLKNAGVETVIVNVHHLADAVEDHLKSRLDLHIEISDERSQLLDSAGGVIKALPCLGNKPFYILNADTFWIDRGLSNLQAMANHFNPDTMDMLLLTVERQQAAAPERGDFLISQDGRLKRAPANMPEAVIYGGALIVHPNIFKDATIEPQSLNTYFDKAIAKGRLFGFPLHGNWYTVGTMDMIGRVEDLLRERGEKA